MSLYPEPTLRRAGPADVPALVALWLRSVRASHTFLTEEDIDQLHEHVRASELAGLDLWLLECAGEPPIGFLGMSGNKLEALFLDPNHFRNGHGRRLVEHATSLVPQNQDLLVDVNEQNPSAVAFYQACGFTVVSRSPLDSAGRPFPLLHLRKSVQLAREDK